MNRPNLTGQEITPPDLSFLFHRPRLFVAKWTREREPVTDFFPLPANRRRAIGKEIINRPIHPRVASRSESFGR